MSQVKLLKISSEGYPVEFNSTSDEITLASFTVQGGGPVMSSTGLDLNNQDVVDVQDLSFTDPSTATINQTAGSLVVDNIMAKERDNVMSTSGSVLFPVITDSAGQVDAFRVPALAGAPSATPTSGGDGYLVANTSNGHLYMYINGVWDDLSTVQDAQNIVDSGYTAEATIAARDVVFISSADQLSPANASADNSSRVLGFAVSAANISDPVQVKKFGRMSGFTSLTAGSRYYLSAASAGQITSTIPSGSGHNIIQVGYAKNATDLEIAIQSLGKRA